jgi:hypothetical protein
VALAAKALIKTTSFRFENGLGEAMIAIRSRLSKLASIQESFSNRLTGFFAQLFLKHANPEARHRISGPKHRMALLSIDELSAFLRTYQQLIEVLEGSSPRGFGEFIKVVPCHIYG